MKTASQSSSALTCLIPFLVAWSGSRPCDDLGGTLLGAEPAPAAQTGGGQPTAAIRLLPLRQVQINDRF